MLGADYMELIVPRREYRGKGLRLAAAAFVGIVLSAGLIVLAFATGMMLLLFLVMLTGFAGWLLWRREKVEYEYVLSGDELRVTKIIAQSKRKELICVSLRDFQVRGRLSAAEPLSESATLVLACAAQDDTAYFADFDHSDYGATRLVFTPDSRMLEYLDKFCRCREV